MLCLAIALTVAATTPADARFFGVVCKANQNLAVDPIVSPGVYPSAHLHTFFCATRVTQDSTLATMEATGTTAYGGVFQGDTGGQIKMPSSGFLADTGGTWIPTMLVGGAPTNPKKLTEYWSDVSIGGRGFVDIPEGAQMVAGEAHATGPPPEYELFWSCGQAFTKTWPDSTTPPACPSTHTLQAHIEFPVCWDGAGLLPSDFVNPGAPTPFSVQIHFYPCPSGFLQLPHLQEIIHTGLSGAQIPRMSFASGPFYTLHGDYWQSWSSQATLHADEQFLRTGVVP